MRLVAAGLLLFAASPVTLQVTDERGKKPGGVTVEASTPDEDGWYKLTVTRSKGEVALVWPFDGHAKQPDGPEPVPVTVLNKGEAKILASRRVVAMLAVPVLLGLRSVAEEAELVGLTAGELEKSVAELNASDDGFEKGIALLWAKKPTEAKDELARGLRARERVMTRIASEIYPAAMLNGMALLQAGKFDEAAVAYLKAVKLRPSNTTARKMRAISLEKAGKPEAAEEGLKKR